MSQNLLKKLGLDATSNYLRFAVTASVPFLLTPHMLHAFGADGFGLWSLTHSILSLFGLMDLGLSNTLIRFLSDCKSPQKANRLVSTVLTLYLGLSLIGLLLLATLAFQVSPFADSTQAFALLWLLGLRNITIALPFGVLRSTLHAQQRFVACNSWQTVLAALYGAAAWGALWSGANLLALAGLMLLFALLEHVGYLLLLRYYQKGFRLHFGQLDRATLKSISSFSLASTMSTLAGLVLLKTDPIIVSLFLPMSAVASYSLALKLAEGVLMLLKQAVNVLTPQFSRMWSGNSLQELSRLYLSASRLALLAGSTLALPLLVFTPQLLELWLGEANTEIVLTARILLAAALLSVPQMVASAALSMGGHHLFTARAAALSTALNLVLSVALVVPLGCAGVALATLLCTLMVDLAAVTRKAFRVLGVTRAGQRFFPLAGPLAAQLLLLSLAPKTTLAFLVISPVSALVAVGLYFASRRKDIV